MFNIAAKHDCRHGKVLIHYMGCHSACGKRVLGIRIVRKNLMVFVRGGFLLIFNKLGKVAIGDIDCSLMFTKVLLFLHFVRVIVR